MDGLENGELKPISTKLKLLLLNLAELGKNYNPKPSAPRPETTLKIKKTEALYSNVIPMYK